MAIKIIAASYGTSTKGADVTARVKTLTQQGNDIIRITNRTMGGDPVPGVRKQFGVVYEFEGKQYARCAMEGQVIDLVTPDMVKDPEVFQLTTLFMESRGVVLEGNGGFDSKNTLGGAAFLSPQLNASGTMWKKIPLDNGFFQLTTLFTESKGLVLEGNGGLESKNTLGGAAFMSGQRNASGTMWKEIPLNNGFFQLTSMFMEKKGVVLEGNGGFNSKNTLGGAAFLSGQQNASGTMWKKLPIK